MNRNKVISEKVYVKNPKDMAKVAKIGKEGEDFIKFCETNNVDFTAFFVAFNVWVNVPSEQKQAVIVELVSKGKVEIGDNVRKDSEGK